MYSLLIKKNGVELEVCADRTFIEKQFEDSLSNLMECNTDFRVEEKNKSTLEIECAPEDFQDSGMPPENFKDFYSRKNIKSAADTLICCAFYLKIHKNISCFTLKDINREVFDVIGKIIDHGAVNEALTRNMLVSFLKEDTTEYALTFIGEEYFENEL